MDYDTFTIKPECFTMLKPHPHLGQVLDELLAIVDPDSDEVVAMLYRIQNVGTFVRRDGVWRFPDNEEKRALEDTLIFDIRRSSAKELVQKFDESIDSGNLMVASDLEPYEDKELI